eukprot:2689601-Prymnesium_polylepis.2
MGGQKEPLPIKSRRTSRRWPARRRLSPRRSASAREAVRRLEGRCRLQDQGLRRAAAVAARGGRRAWGTTQHAGSAHAARDQPRK